MNTYLNLKDVYKRRFISDTDYRQKMWAILCREFFQQFIPEESTVLEIAAGLCEFVNNIVAKNKIAVDINCDTKNSAESDVKVIITPSNDLRDIQGRSVDVIFISNFFEHIDKETIFQTIIECARVLKDNGKMLILQPNIRFAYRNYWMFYDHITPIDDRALCEVIELSGMSIEKCISQFLPFTTKNKLPKLFFLLRLYLKLPLLWKIFGQQAFIIARK